MWREKHKLHSKSLEMMGIRTNLIFTLCFLGWFTLHIGNMVQCIGYWFSPYAINWMGRPVLIPTRHHFWTDVLAESLIGHSTLASSHCFWATECLVRPMNPMIMCPSSRFLCCKIVSLVRGNFVQYVDRCGILKNHWQRCWQKYYVQGRQTHTWSLIEIGNNKPLTNPRCRSSV